MSDNKIIKTTQYKLKNLSIVSKVGIIDISGYFEEINIYDGIFTPCITGTILIKESLGLSNKLSFDGSEVLIIEMGKTEELATFRKSFRIWKQSSRESPNFSSETYILHFVSDEFILSQQLKLSQSFNGTYSDIVSNILREHLGIENKSISFFENSIGVRKLLIPRKTPFDAIQLCARKAVNIKESPTFLFFENKTGYNFVTTSTLLSNDSVYTINLQPKNLSGDSSGELLGATSFEVISQFDYNKGITSGMYAGTFIGFDILTRSIAKKYVNYETLYTSSEHANKTPNIGVVENKTGRKNIEMFDSKVKIFPCSVFSQTSDYVKQNYPEMINYDDDTYNYIIQREAAFRALLNQRIKISTPGNFDLTSGLTMDMLIPNRSQQGKIMDDIDYSLSGKYLIIASRQIITYQKHETVLELATDSNNREAFYTSTKQQEGALIAYE